jgi:hypothetical protein
MAVVWLEERDRNSQMQHTCLAGRIQTQHEQAHFLGSEDLVHHLGD